MNFNLNSIKTFGRAAGKFLAKNSPTILEGLSVGGFLCAISLGVSATVKAVRQVDEAEKEKGEKLTPKEVVKEVWPLYIPTALATVGSAFCGYASLHESNKRNASLAVGYGLYEAAYNETNEKLEKYLSKKKVQEMKDEIADEKIQKATWDDRTVVNTGTGQQLFLESITGQQFMSDVETIRKAANDANEELLNNRYYITVNEYLDYIPNVIADTISGDMLAFTPERGSIKLDLSSATIIKNGPYAGKSAIYIQYDTEPVPTKDVY